MADHAGNREGPKWTWKHCIFTAFSFASIPSFWSFPYLTYRDGGGAYALLFILLVVFLYSPLLLLQLHIGSITKTNVVQLFSKYLPIAKGHAVAMMIQLAIWIVIQQTCLGYLLTYMFKTWGSTTETYPWSDCSNQWNTDRCQEYEYKPTDVYDGYPDDYVSYDNYGFTQSPAEQYFNIHILRMRDDWGDLGPVVPGLAWPTFLGYVFTLGLVAAGPRIFPWIAAVAGGVASFLLVMALGFTYIGLDGGSLEGLRFTFLPSYRHLQELRVWHDASGSAMYATMAFSGLLISYGKFCSTKSLSSYLTWVPIVTVAALVPIIVTVMLSGLVGALCDRLGVDFSDVMTGGVGIVTYLIPTAAAVLKLPPWWTFVIYAAGFLFTALSQGLMVLILLEIVMDYLYCERLRKMFPRKIIVRLVVAVVMVFLLFLLTLPLITEGGHLLFSLIDTFAGKYSMFYTIPYAVALIVVYGQLKGIPFMLKQILGGYAAVAMAIVLMILFVVMIPRLLEYEYYGSMGYVYPPKARALGVIVAIGPLIFDLIGAIHALVTAPGNIEMKMVHVMGGDTMVYSAVSPEGEADQLTGTKL